MELWERELLADCRVGRLGTIGRAGQPRILPVCYAAVGEEIVVAVDEKPKRPGKLARLSDIERDPRVTLLVDRWDEDWSRLAWVRVEAEAMLVATGGKRPDALAALRERYPQYRGMRLEAVPLIVLRPRRVVSWRAAALPASG